LLDRDELIEHVEWLLNEGENKQARKLCQSGLRRYPRDAELWMYMGDSLIDSEETSEADRAFRRAAEIRPHWAVPWAKRAEVQLLRGNFGQACRMVDRAHELDRDLGHASHLKAICCDLEGRSDEGRFWYRRAQRLQPDHFFCPPKVSPERFQQELDCALEHLDRADAFAPAIRSTRWVVLERTADAPPDVARIDPLASVVLLAAVDGAAGQGPELSEPVVETGYIFKPNILRECRTADDIYTQLYVCILEELEGLVLPARGDHESSSGR